VLSPPEVVVAPKLYRLPRRSSSLLPLVTFAYRHLPYPRTSGRASAPCTMMTPQMTMSSIAMLLRRLTLILRVRFTYVVSPPAPLASAPLQPTTPPLTSHVYITDVVATPGLPPSSTSASPPLPTISRWGRGVCGVNEPNEDGLVFTSEEFRRTDVRWCGGTSVGAEECWPSVVSAIRDGMDWAWATASILGIALN
jgi:hypothetical protein